MNEKLEIRVSEENAGERLDRFLAMQEKIHSRSRATHLIERKMILVNGKEKKASYPVMANDIITVEIPEEKATTLQPMKMDLEVLFEDSDVLVINKPAGLVVHPAAGHEQDTLVNALIAHSSDFLMKFANQRPGIVHRLDKDTSGIMVVAKNDIAHENLSKQFKQRTVHRIYFSVVHGVPAKAEGRIQSYLARHISDRKRYASVKDSDRKIIREALTNPPGSGKFAITEYQIKKSYKGALSLLKLKLHTGRTHQIRVHMSEMGHSVMADPIYGKSQQYPKTFVDLIKKIPRLALHAAELGFKHPTTNEELLFKVDWPPDLKSVMQEFSFEI